MNRLLFDIKVKISYLFRNQKKIEKDTLEYLKKLPNFSNTELCEIYTNLNTFKWDERLGEEPDWHKMGNEENLSWNKEMYSTRRCCNVMREIKKIVGDREILRHLKVVHGKGTEEEFEEFFRKYFDRHTHTFEF